MEIHMLIPSGGLNDAEILIWPPDYYKMKAVL